MQVSLIISDDIVREAANRNMPVVEFIEMLVDRGLKVVRERPVMNNAMERIRALRTSTITGK